MVEWGDPELQKMSGVRRNHPPPVIPLYVAPYLRAFQELKWNRNNGLGRVGGIPLSAILEYADWIEPQNVDFFVTMIQDMDYFYLDRITDKRNKQNE